MTRRRILSAVVLGAMLTVSSAIPALAQTPEATPASGGKGYPWIIYMAWAALGLAGFTVLALGAGYLIQSKGWGGGKRGAAAGGAGK